MPAADLLGDRLVKGVGFLMRKHSIDVYEGTGRFLDGDKLQVNLNEGDEETLAFKHAIIATGARPRTIPGVEIDGERIITYWEAIMSEELPEKAVIVGAGPIGMEFAYVWANYGVEVTIVEMLPHLLPNEDPEVSQVLEKAYRKLGIKYHVETKVEAISATDDGVRVELEGQEPLDADQVMIAIGFRANVEDIGLDAAGVELNDHGTVAVDEMMRTNVDNIFAIGDVVAPEGIMLAHVASTSPGWRSA